MRFNNTTLVIKLGGGEFRVGLGLGWGKGLVTSRKRSLGQGNAFTTVYHSVHRASQHASDVRGFYLQEGSASREVCIQGVCLGGVCIQRGVHPGVGQTPQSTYMYLCNFILRRSC